MINVQGTVSTVADTGGSFGDTLYACAIIDLAEATVHSHMTHYSITVLL